MAEHRVYMYFFERQGWTYQFLEPDCQTLIGRIHTAATEAQLRALIARTPTPLSAEDRRKLDADFARGRGSLWLTLTPAQHASLHH